MDLYNRKRISRFSLTSLVVLTLLCVVVYGRIGNTNEAITEPVIMEIDWDAAGRSPRADDSTVMRETVQTVPMESKGLAGLSEVTLPVLLPLEAHHAATAVDSDGDSQVGRVTEIREFMFFPYEYSYAAGWWEGDQFIEIEGTRIGFNVPAIEGSVSEDVRGQEYLIERAPYGVALSFQRFGAGYSVVVHCQNPSTDPECTRNEFIEDIADSLVFVGGAK